MEDTGCGIGKEDLERIMSPYEQVNVKAARHGGTGIGLALCRSLAKAMGGDISVDTAPGRGSTFAVEIPASSAANEKPSAPEKVPEPEKAPAPEKAPVPAATPAPAPAPSANRRILIVDDQKMNLMVLKAMLKKIGGFDVAMASNGREALAAIESPDSPLPDIVLTDMWMPEMDGVGLVKAIRANGKFRSLPVHVVTADVEMQGRYKEAGFTSILLKPVTIEVLKELLK